MHISNWLRIQHLDPEAILILLVSYKEEYEEDGLAF